MRLRAMFISEKTACSKYNWACNPSTEEAEAGGSEVQALLGYIARPCLKEKTRTRHSPMRSQLKIRPYHCLDFLSQNAIVSFF
jgi:hypothetical protein